MIHLVGDHAVLCIVGNAKNAGKTTVLNALVSAHAPTPVGVTSIGLDGEALDAVSSLPKPRIVLPVGALAATAERCLEATEARVEIVRRTDLGTALGPVLIVRIRRPGAVLVAGPTTVSDTERAVAALRDLGAVRVFVDGAFARGSHAAAGDALVYVAGAHLSPSMDRVVEATRYALRRFELPAADPALAPLEREVVAGWIDDVGAFHPIGAPGVPIPPDAILDRVPAEARWLLLPGALGPDFARRFVERRAETRCGLVVRSPLAIVLPDDRLRHLFLTGRDIRVLHPMKVAFVAVNPYSPDGHRFDGRAFADAVRAVTPHPVIDVQGGSA